MIFSKIRHIVNKYPITRGMLTYSVSWPVANLVQQSLNGKDIHTYNWKEALRFSIFGTFYVAPTLYCWIRFTSLMWPSTAIKTAILKTCLEQVSYGPFAIASFLYFINLLEGKASTECLEQVKLKFFTTWKTGVCVWPIIQITNFSLIPEQNRVIFVSFCSFIWIIYLAYIKHLNEAESLM